MKLSDITRLRWVDFTAKFMPCKRCLEPLPSNYAARKCAFDDEGNFTPKNWNCGTANKIRKLMCTGEKWDSFNSRCDDNSIGLFYVPEFCDDEGGFEFGSFWLLGFWYKERGAMDNLYSIESRAEKDGGHVLVPLTLNLAELILSNLDKS